MGLERVAWSVFDGTDSGSREDLFRYSRLQTPHAKAVFAGLDWADDSDWYIEHAIDGGFRPSPKDVIKLVEEWGYGDILRLVRACEGPFSQKQLLALLENVDDGLLPDIVRHAISTGMKLDDDGICAVCELCYDKNLADALVACRMADRGPYTAAELCPPIGKPCIAEFCSHETVEGLLGSMHGRFTYDQAMDFVTYHICDDYTDDTLEAILSVTRCSQEEADELLFGNGYSRRPDPLLVQPSSQPVPVKIGFFEALGLAFLGKQAWDALHGPGATAAGEPMFQDFNNAWGGNNDHNWEADGDMRWDDYSGL